MDRLRLFTPVSAPATPRDSGAIGMKLSELIGSLSQALDITEGQPRGHCVRVCWIGTHIGKQIGLATPALHELYYTLLLKDLGCSSNAARICELYLTDDLSFKRDFKTVGDSLPQMLRFVFSHTGLNARLSERLGAILNIMRNGPQIADELIQTRCTRGADIARQLRFSEGVAAGIASLDEHWDGGGRPQRLQGQAIPLYARIALLSQVIDVFHTTGGPGAAMQEARERAGGWFDPDLVRAFESVALSPRFWLTLASPGVEAAVFAMDPAEGEVVLDDDYLDDIAAAFGQVVDTKSPFTSGHSARVAQYVDAIASQLGLPAARRRWLRRGALLHDVGKLGVSNAVLDKPGKLDRDEWAAVQRHAQFTEDILSRIGAFAELARVSAAHHERLDGGGYPRGLKADQIPMETRIITTADIFDALSAERPYRPAIPVGQTLEMMAQNVGSAIDPLCYDALRAVVAAGARESACGDA
jgi:HD-GYP domain-containing protein (c-di-GMP phosphodiesterase class II)